MDTETALATAIELINLAHEDHLTPEINAVLERLIAIGNQRGCEHFDSACDGTLCHLIDIIIDG